MFNMTYDTFLQYLFVASKDKFEKKLDKIYATLKGRRS